MRSSLIHHGYALETERASLLPGFRRELLLNPEVGDARKLDLVVGEILLESVELGVVDNDADH